MKVSSFFKTFNISSNGMSAEKKRLAITAENIANANTTRTAEGKPYRRKVLTQKAMGGTPFFSELKNARIRLRTSQGKHVAKPSRGAPRDGSGALTRVKTKVHEQNEFRKVYEPGHPDADENGMVSYPDINVVTEMLELISSSRAYEANITIMNAAKSMAKRALSI